MRQQPIPGFDQEKYSRAHVLCIGAGGLVGQVAPALVRKGIGALTILDDDVVEVSNLNRQRFYLADVGRPKAITVVQNLRAECTFSTVLKGHALRLEEAVARGVDLACDIAICGVDNNPTRVVVSRLFRSRGIPVVFLAVSAQADHGYVFIQHENGPCFVCVFPDVEDDRGYPCPGTRAVVDILQIIGGLAVYAVDSCVMRRPRNWNYRAVHLRDGTWDSSQMISPRLACDLCETAAN